ncbi:MOSC domain-containing protein [Niveibacterium sp. 24ML]|uniref:MOSC domain-containing protein n=1 Tax=Niveibacterium sp. 24ML TaxID=2985512 RepID=UPI002270CD1C|nr:MOSC domain-containing protein [Niveibacterium sp. 24ML]MCX9157688.1 MOSC domain-containing protein [Niveibacterium sp. 24ML]
MSRVIKILIAAQDAPMNSVQQVDAVAGCGLRGDRYFKPDGNADPASQITLIERECIDAFVAETGLALSHDQPRRNLVTEGVRLNDLCGKRFRVGDVELEGIELCEPCSTFAQRTYRQVVKTFVGKGGLRARIVTSGTINVGDAITPLD